jgi:hypothetical protein
MAKKKPWQKKWNQPGDVAVPETDLTESEQETEQGTETGEPAVAKPTSGPGSTHGTPANRTPDSAPGKTITDKDGTRTID